MGVDRQIVEEEVGKTVARHMLRQLGALRKDQARRIDSASLRLAAQVAHRGLAGLQQPQHAAVDLVQKAHPDIEYVGRDLVAVVEAAEYKSIIGQADRMPRRVLGRDHTPGIVHPIADRKVHDPLAVMLLLVERQDDGVGHDVIDIVDRHGGGEAEIADLDRCRAVGQDRRTGTLGVALEIDGNIDSEIADELRDVLVAAHGHIVKLVKGPDQPSTDLASVVRPIGNAQHLEAFAIVPLEQLGDLPAGRMLVEGRGKVSDLDPLRLQIGGCSRQRSDRRHPGAHKPLRMAQLLRRSERIGEQRERLDLHPALIDGASQLGAERAELVPVADHKAIESKAAKGARVAGGDRQHLSPRCDRFLVASEIGERLGAMIERLGIVGRKRQRAVEVLQRVGKSACGKKGGAAVVQRARVAPIDRERLIEALQRPVEATQLNERQAAIVERIDIARRDRQRAREARQRLLVPRQAHQDIPARDQRGNCVAVEPQCALAIGQSVIEPAELLERHRPVAQRVDITGIFLDRPIVAGERLGVTAEPREGIAAIGERAKVAGRPREHGLVTGGGLLEPRKRRQRVAALEQGIRVAALARQELVEGR